MKYRISSRIVRAGVVVLGSALVIALPRASLPATRAAAGMPPVDVSALYKITLNGFEIGSLRFTSSVTPSTYTLDSDVELSALLGAFHWRGVSRTAGTIAGAAPRPAGFLFEFESTTRSGSVRLGFDRDRVASVSVLPPSVADDGLIPVTEQHMKGVLDPLTAILALTHGDGNPCARKVSIFDGKQRFDLVLSYNRQTPIGEGQAEMATVCRVKYVPIAGFSASEETRAMASSTGIEITFRSVPNASLMVPHQVVVPTIVGPAEITALRVDIKASGRGEIALVN